MPPLISDENKNESFRSSNFNNFLTIFLSTIFTFLFNIFTIPIFCDHKLLIDKEKGEKMLQVSRVTCTEDIPARLHFKSGTASIQVGRSGVFHFFYFASAVPQIPSLFSPFSWSVNDFVRDLQARITKFIPPHPKKKGTAL
ncbi:hypothetical protein AN963_01820 [Brevibacillus choshinensis]|uniref:Uncharacterized protein n=1 Tax=Brevibacillus choshinensis TaxID=54911 RepID=A0ABR5NB04_BRECH|nr:hypothetical protein AN963_01820 [Brevibacillus choshinensis]